METDLSMIDLLLLALVKGGWKQIYPIIDLLFVALVEGK